MKYFKYIIVIFFVNNVYSQVLYFPEVIQEQTEWCWAAVSKSILNYYNFPISQCEIAEYARQTSDWHNYGVTNCCQNPSLGCNYWNYNWGQRGSIKDILVHFGNIQNNGSNSFFTKSAISREISAGRPFVIRWERPSGGHFIVGHGIDDDFIYYMDPWFGEGLHIGTYNRVCNDGYNRWTHTNMITTKSYQPPTITTNTLPTGSIGTVYNQSIIATGETPITWEIAWRNLEKNVLPDGLTLDEATGVISGIPAMEGSFNFTVTATNNAGFYNKALSIEIEKDATIIKTTQPPILKAYLHNNTLYIFDLIAGERLSVYTITGISVYEYIASGEEEALNEVLPFGNGIYIVRSGNRTIKVIKN